MKLILNYCDLTIKWIFFCNNLFILSPFADLSIEYVNLEKSENLERHRTEGFSSSNALVVRRGAPFKISLQLKGRQFNPKTDTMRIKVMLGNLDLVYIFAVKQLFGSIILFEPLFKISLLNYLSCLSRPPQCDNASHFHPAEGFFLPLESLHWPRGSEPPEPLYLHLLSCLCLSGLLQVSAVCVH